MLWISFPTISQSIIIIDGRGAAAPEDEKGFR